jgi:hypothetical protein
MQNLEWTYLHLFQESGILIADIYDDKATFELVQVFVFFLFP